MTGILKKFFGSKRTVNDIIHECELDDRAKEKRSMKTERFGRGSEVDCTAAYHTLGQPRACKSTRSYAGGEVSDSDERYEYFNKLLEIKRRSFGNSSRRRRFSKSWGRRRNISEYENASLQLGSLIRERTLDDSESDSWTLEREKQNYELEKKLQEEREKLKEYRERFKIERDLRVSREQEVREYRERFKLERELRFRREQEIVALKESLKKMRREQEKLMAVTSNLQFWEQQQRYRTMFPALINGVTDIGAGAGESLCTISASSMPMPSSFVHSDINNQLDEIDETKNFRRINLFDSELPRSTTSLSSINSQEPHELTLLHGDNLDFPMYFNTTTSRRTRSDSDLYRFSQSIVPLFLQLRKNAIIS